MLLPRETPESVIAKLEELLADYTMLCTAERTHAGGAVVGGKYGQALPVCSPAVLV
jgi:hypothetical protein